MDDGLGDIRQKLRVFAAACGGRTTRSPGFDVMQGQSSLHDTQHEIEISDSDLDDLPLTKQ